MKYGSLIAVFLFFLLIGGFVFVILNKPANLFIRKSFQQIKEMRLTNSSEQAAQKALISSLNEHIKQSNIRQDSILKANTDLEKKLVLKELREKSLEARNKELTSQLHEAKSIHAAMGVTDQLILFDQQTDGSKATFIIDYEGHEMAVTEPARISDANWKIHEGAVTNELYLDAMERIDVLHDQITIVKSINANLNSVITECQSQNQTEIKKRELCEETVEAAMKTARRVATGGGIAIIAAIVILIL